MSATGHSIKHKSVFGDFPQTQEQSNNIRTLPTATACCIQLFFTLHCNIFCLYWAIQSSIVILESTGEIIWSSKMQITFLFFPDSPPFLGDKVFLRYVALIV
jgi:hypothetical protein